MKNADIETISSAMETALIKFFDKKDISQERAITLINEEELRAKLKKLSPFQLRLVNSLIHELLLNTRFEVIRDIPKLLETTAKKGDILYPDPYKDELALFHDNKVVCTFSEDYRNYYYRTIE